MLSLMHTCPLGSKHLAARVTYLPSRELEAAGWLLYFFALAGQVLPGFNAKGQIEPNRSQPALHRLMGNHQAFSAHLGRFSLDASLQVLVT
jgi:hypothetical protein